MISMILCGVLASCDTVYRYQVRYQIPYQISVIFIVDFRPDFAVCMCTERSLSLPSPVLCPENRAAQK